MKIITGATGATHVTSNNDGEFNQGIFGDGLVVLQNGNKLTATAVNNNLIEIKDGDLIFQGRHALIEPGMTDELTIGTGAVDLNRNDLIVIRYQLNDLTGYESMTLEVIQGEETGGEAHDPDYVDADIRTGALIAEAPLYRVKIRGISIDAIEPFFTATADSLESRVGSVETNLTVENTPFVFDKQDGAFGFNTDPLRAVASFVPFASKELGKVYVGTTLTLEIPSRINTKIATITVPPGAYILTATAQWEQGFQDATTFAVTGTGVAVTDRNNGINGGSCNITAIFNRDADTSISFYATQFSSVTRNLSGNWLALKAIKIA